MKASEVRVQRSTLKKSTFQFFLLNTLKIVVAVKDEAFRLHRISCCAGHCSFSVSVIFCVHGDQALTLSAVPPNFFGILAANK